MASDALRLLFELDVDSRAGTAGLLRFRKDIAATIAAARRAITQPLQGLSSAPSAAVTKAAVTAQTLANSQTRATQSAQRLQIGQQRLAVASTQVAAAQQRAANAVQRAANGQTQAAAGAIRAATAYQRATAAANSFAQSQNLVRRAVASVQSSLRSLGSSLQSAGRSLTVVLTVPILALGAAALKSAKDIDANVNTLKAFTGSAEAAERRLAQLIKTARGTPGLTTNLALTLDAQLRVAQTTQETIDRVLPAIGRLNAVSKLQDPARFTQNLQQLVTQNFERQDLKELVGQSPLAGQLITEIFNVDSPINAKAIRASAKKLGITTVDSFFTAFADAAQRNQGLATVTESIGTRFDKIVDRVTVALRPLGLAILNAIEPFIEPVAKLIERIGEAFGSLSKPVQTAIIVIAGIAAAAGPVLLVLGGLATAIASVVAAIGAIASAVAAVGLPAIAAAVGGIVIIIGEWVAILAALGLAWRTNFLNIRGLVTDAASAVIQAFERIRAITEETIQRILPTLQSITTKVLGIVTLAWEKYGKDVIAVVSAAFTFVTRVIETFVKVFGNIIDLLLKLIDGDFRGAWAAFARIVLAAVDAFDEAINKIPGILIRAFIKVNMFLGEQAARFAVAGMVLAAALVTGIVRTLIDSAPKVRDALVDMFLLAAQGFDPSSIAAIVVARFIAALRRAAKDNPPPRQSRSESAEPPTREDLAGEGEFRKKQASTETDDDKGADAAARRRIRILELEADKVRTLTDAQLAREQIAFDERKKSLEEFTAIQIKAAGDVLLAQLAIYKQERAEAAKIRNESVRDLALAEIGQKEFEAQQAFTTKVAQLEAVKRKEEFEATKAHREAILDIQEEGDRKQLELIDSYVERYLLSYEDAEKRRLAIEEKSRERRRSELVIQLGEAGQNVQEQQRVKDAIAKLDAESATAKEEAENRKRRALRATLEAEQDYYNTLAEITQRAAQVLRDAANVELDRLFRKFGDRRRFRLEALKREREASEAEHNERLRQIEQEKKDAEKRLEGVRDAEEKLLKLRKYYADLEKAERERRAAERRKEDDDERDARDPFSTLRKRLENFLFDIKNVNESIFDSLRSVAEQVNSAIGSMADALRQGIAAWILYGESLGKALKRALAEQLAALSAEFAIQALKHAAYALGSLAFGDFAGAAKHAAAAAAFTAAAAATGFAGRALARSSGMHSSSASAGTASAAVSGGQPQNREFQYGGTAVEPSSIAAREGSAAARTGVTGMIMNAVDEVKLLRQEQAALTAKLDSTLSRIKSLPAGDVVAMGAPNATQAIGIAVLQSQKENNDISREMATNMGF